MIDNLPFFSAAVRSGHRVSSSGGRAGEDSVFQGHSSRVDADMDMVKSGSAG